MVKHFFLKRLKRSIYALQQKLHYFRFKKKYQLSEQEKKFDCIFSDNQAYVLSKKERAHNPDFSLTYGEVAFLPFCALLHNISANCQDIFYDLGSGAGKACIIALQVFNVSESHGIECLTSLVGEANRLRAKLPPHLKQRYLIEEGDFITKRIERASIIFINATGFFNDKWQDIVQFLIKNTKQNARLIIASKRLPLDNFSLIKTTRCHMQFGEVTVNIYQKN